MGTLLINAALLSMETLFSRLRRYDGARGGDLPPCGGTPAAGAGPQMAPLLVIIESTNFWKQKKLLSVTVCFQFLLAFSE